MQEYLVDEVWIKVCGRRGRTALYICCIYMPTDSTCVLMIDSSYDKLKEDVLSFK